MHGKRGFMCILLILFITYFPTIGIHSDELPERFSVGNIQIAIVVSNSYIPHGPIIIRNNSDFASQGWPGGGIPGNPYIIENLDIKSDEICIQINNTDAFFELRNCLITSDGESPLDGIRLCNVSYGIIINCFAELHHNGFRFWNCSECIALNNTASDNSLNSFYCEESFNCTMINNTASDSGFRILRCPSSVLINNTSTGFSLLYCNSSIMINNTASLKGVFLYHSSNSTLVNNTVINYYYGFEILNSPYSILHHNTAWNNNVGFYIYDSNYCNLTVNTAIQSSNTGFRFYRSPFCTIHYNELSSRGIDIGGTYLDCWLHDVVNNTIDTKELGYFKSVNDAMIDASTFGQVILVNCSSVTIVNGVFSNCIRGTQLMYCTECYLTNNTSINSSADSIDSGFDLRYCNSCTLIQNVVTNCYGGFYFGNSTSLILNDNFASNCFYGVILGSESTSCMISNNVIIENEFGINIYQSCSFNLIYLNHFANNSLANGYDDGFSNSWDNGTHGNFWDDYDCSGSYTISGNAGSVDNHPYLYGAVCPTTSTSTAITTSTTITNTAGFDMLQVIILSGLSIGLATVVCLVIFKFVRAKK